MTSYVTNGWSWFMSNPKKGLLEYEDLSEDEFMNEIKGAISRIGNPILAQILRLPYNPSYININEGDVAFVINLRGGRIPVGAEEFPEDVDVKYTRVEIKEAATV